MSHKLMKNQTYSLTQETIKLINHLYALRIIDDNKTTKGDLIAEAFTLLAEREEKGSSEK